MREVCKGPGTKKDAGTEKQKRPRRHSFLCHQTCAPFADLLNACIALRLSCRSRACSRATSKQSDVGGGGGRRGDARTVPSIKVSSAFVYLGKNNSSLSSNPRIFEMNLS